MNRQIMFQSRLQGSLRVMRKYPDVLGADQTESGIWVREIDHIHYRKRKLVTLRLRCESVSNSLNISRTKKKNVVTTPVVRTLWQPSDVKVVVRPVRCRKGSSDWWTFLTMNFTTIFRDKVSTVQPLFKKSLQRLTTPLRGGVKQS